MSPFGIWMVCMCLHLIPDQPHVDYLTVALWFSDSHTLMPALLRMRVSEDHNDKEERESKIKRERLSGEIV